MTTRLASAGSIWTEPADDSAGAGVQELQLIADPAGTGDAVFGSGVPVAELTASGPGGDYLLTTPGAELPSVDRAHLLARGAIVVIV